MADVAVRVRNLGKQYRLGRPVVNHLLREALGNAIRSPLRALGRFGPRGRSATGESDHIWALQNVSFDTEHGQIVGIVGPNGARKSTLLKILSRITEPTTGRVEIHGRVGSLAEVGTGFHPELTGRENVYLSGAILGMRKKEIARRFDEMVAFAEVERFIDTPVKRYSSGMYLRLAFAVAAHLEPEVLLVDEVLAVGDAAFQRKCLGRMRDEATRGRTVLFVGHNMAAITQLCGRAVWLDDGAVRAVGPSAEVVRDYLAAGGGQCAERVWNDAAAPGDERVRLRACRVVQDGRSTGVVDINRDARIEIEFEALRAARDLVTGASLYDLGGLCLFNCCDWRSSSLEPGRYRKSMEIPARTLTEGRFSVLLQCVFFAPDVKSVVLPDALVFDAAESDAPSAVRGAYKGAWPGAVRLALPWSDVARVGSLQGSPP